MKTSPIRHPKYEHATTVHSWMVKACHGNITAALLLGYLESKFHICLETGNPHKNWMKLSKFQIKHGCFSEWDDLELGLDILKGLQFIEIDDLGGEDRPLGNGEVWIKFNAKTINNWLEVYQKPVEAKISLFNFSPFMALLWFTNATYIEIPVEKEVLVEKVVVKEIKERVINVDETYIGVARDLFAFWRYIHKHPRSNLQDKYAKMIIDRIKQNYTQAQIAQGILGLNYSEYHKKNSFDHIQYVVKESAKLDRLIDVAAKNNISEAVAEAAYNQYLKQRDSGELEPAKKEGVNPITGNTLK